jgi:glyoxylase-like metal-dependent hydrolase (beta-lactamase superfamily II)
MSGLDVRAFSLGPVQTNAYIVRADRHAKVGVVVDPGEEPERLLEALRVLELKIEAILITHCHFDHIGAVAPLAKATEAPVYCPDRERVVLADIMSFVLPGFGPFEGYEADHLLLGGEVLQLADLRIDVLPTPGHSPGHLTYAVSPAPSAAPSQPAGGEGAGESLGGGSGAGSDSANAPAAVDADVALFSGDVLFQGSVGRVDLPGGDWAVLERSIGMLLERFPAQTVVYPGHMGATTLGRERDTNPFLQELSATITRQQADAQPSASAANTQGTVAQATAVPGLGGAGAN